MQSLSTYEWLEIIGFVVGVLSLVGNGFQAQANRRRTKERDQRFFAGLRLAHEALSEIGDSVNETQQLVGTEATHPEEMLILLGGALREIKGGARAGVCLVETLAKELLERPLPGSSFQSEPAAPPVTLPKLKALAGGRTTVQSHPGKLGTGA